MCNNNLITMKKLTKAEEELMQVVWILKECTVGDIRNYLAKQAGGKKPPHSTISTMMKILGEKSFVSHRAYGRTFVYSPSLSKSEYGKQSINNLVGNYFGGSANQLVSFLIKENDLSLSELSELINKLDEKKE